MGRFQRPSRHRAEGEPTTAPPAPDRLLVWVLSVVGLGIGGNLVANWLLDDWRWAGFALGFLLLVTVLAIRPGGYLSRDRYGPTYLGMAFALTAATLYLLVGVFTARNGNSLVVNLTATTCLWLCSALLTWRAMRIEKPATSVALAMASVLAAASLVLFASISSARANPSRTVCSR